MVENIIYIQKSKTYSLDIIHQIEGIKWKAGAFLARRIKSSDFHEQDVVVVITDQQGELIGFCALTQKDIAEDESKYGPFLSTMFVSEKYRNKGYAKKLVQLIIDEAIKRSISSLYILTQHIGLYEKYGFNQIDQILDIHGREMRVLVKQL